MGLFSFVGKALGKVAKAGLSVATKGLSDKVFSALKGKGQKPGPSKPAAYASMQNQALLAKIGAPVPKLSRTESGYVAPRRPAKRRSSSSSSTRRAPKGGLDLVAIGKLYQSQGKPGGDWRGFVKAHSNIRKG